MDKTKNINHGWLQKDSPKSKEWTIMRPLHRWQKMDSIRLVLAISTSKQWEVHHMDVKSDFIHGDLQE